MPKSVLVVDDSTTIRKMVMYALRTAGLRVITARDGLEALELLAGQQPDLIITDLNMPRLDGFGLVQAIRKDRAYKEVPIIILSSRTGDEDVDRGLESGATAFLPKPFDQKRIQYEVAKYI